MSARIVGIGASAGGLEALESFFSELRSGLGLAYVVVQHLSPDHESYSTEILQRVTSLRVVPLLETTVPVPDHVYVRAPDLEVQVDKYALRTLPRPTDRSEYYRPIDDFFTTLATAHGEDAIAILLSGMGSDGSRGLLEVKDRGGMVMVQDAETARFEDMPRAALRDQLPDLVLPPDQLARRLAAFIQKTGSPNGNASDEPERYSPTELRQALLDRVNESSRVDFNRYRPGTILRRIEKRILLSSFSSLREYVNFALGNEEELQLLRESFLIGVTRFFRDQEAFNSIRLDVLPELCAVAEDREVRIWVPACSTGEEVYTLAILMHDYLTTHGISRPFKIFGSDVDRRAIITAAEGVYSDHIAADVPPEWLQRYFVRSPQGYTVCQELKEHVLFAVQNLLDDPPFIRIDLLSCRNFLIYINGEDQQRILNNFYFSLNPTGVLMLGPSESLGSLQRAFTDINRRWKIYRKRQGEHARSAQRIQPPQENPLPRGRQLPLTPYRLKDAPDGENSTAWPAAKLGPTIMDQFARFLSERYAPATLFVDQHYTILYLNGDFNGMLRLPRFNAHLTLQSVVNDEARNLLTAGVDRILRTGKSGAFERINVADSKSAPRYLRVRFSLQDVAQPESPVAMIEFLPAAVEPEEVASHSSTEEVFTPDGQLREKIEVLENQLMLSEQRAQKLYNELEATNEELQSSNRELLASNEEMHSANEELQSVNEELYTVNAEFQRKNEELNNINNDVHNLMKSTQISTIFVDNQLRIRRFTPGMGQQFDLHVTDLGRPITSFSTPFDNLNIEELCHFVLQTNSRHDQEIEDRHGNFYLLRMLPYVTDQHRVEGVVITFVDINDLVTTRRRLTDMAQKYAAIFNNTEETIGIMRENSRIEEINRPLAGRSREDLVGIYFADLITEVEDKVKFSETLRATFNDQEIGQLSITISDPDDQLLYLKLQLLPIVKVGSRPEDNEVNQVMVMVQDITEFEVERRQSTAIIDQYKKTLSYLQQDAGLINLDEQLILVNHMPTHLRSPDQYPDRYLSDFIRPAGLERFRRALNRLKEGSPMEEIRFTEDELVDDAHPRRVLYRPVYISGRLRYISFEVVENT
ncbi:CheR family methyltransferase [Neolewinella litorea]|uniref:PAS domain-containing protein n=1 Tax=Neolewinella litorea TaxID=2562452 RepID=A0A4S4NQ29_9BACT|nr:CheR family methyltransferase [Neolewinella litorea]THH42052.1 PAS domain-containing protein [Neolewinella litorea]